MIVIIVHLKQQLLIFAVQGDSVDYQHPNVVMQPDCD